MTSRQKMELKRKYSLTPEAYMQMLTDQGSGCCICGIAPTKGKRFLAVDHDHETGKVRGLLCFNCNVMLGKLKDSAAFIKWWAPRACRYLEAGDIVSSMAEKSEFLSIERKIGELLKEKDDSQ